MKRLRICACLLTACLTATAPAQSAPTGARGAATAPAKPSPFEVYIHSELNAAIADMQKTGEVDDARKRIAAAFEQVISRATDKQYDLFRDADFALRLARQMGKLPVDRRRDELDYLRSHDALARTLVFTVKPDDSVPEVYALLDKLRAQRAVQMDSFANLAAAICVVHDTPLLRHINDVKVRAPDPLAIFDYYVANERAMAFGIRNVPPELLIYVVDTTCTIDEMRWALANYTRDPMVGRHFFDIKYDEAYFRVGAPKKLDSVPYNLPNILKVGGVCADQAYFAVSIGKAIGVPAAYTVGESAETGHAWVGFLQAQGTRGAWNFDVGRYEEFRGVRGLVEDPQTRDGIPDAFLSYTAEMINTTPAARQTALALSDAAYYISQFEKDEPFAAAAIPPEAATGTQPIRRAATLDALELCRQSLVQNPGNGDAWYTMAWLAHEGKMTFEQKKEWSDELMKKNAQKYPDFAVSILAPMIETIEDPAKQNSLWNAAFERFQSRADLAAFIRMKQAALWEKQKDLQKAGLCYEDVINRYVNAGPFVLNALVGAEQALRDRGTPEKVVLLYQQTWAKCQKPSDMAGEFARQSNWYTVGSMLVRRLVEARMTQQAAQVQAILNQAAGW